MFQKRERTWGHLDQQLQACLLLGSYQGRLDLYLQFEPCISTTTIIAQFL